MILNQLGTHTYGRHRLRVPERAAFSLVELLTQLRGLGGAGTTQAAGVAGTPQFSSNVGALRALG